MQFKWNVLNEKFQWNCPTLTKRLPSSTTFTPIPNQMQWTIHSTELKKLIFIFFHIDLADRWQMPTTNCSPFNIVMILFAINLIFLVQLFCRMHFLFAFTAFYFTTFLECNFHSKQFLNENSIECAFTCIFLLKQGLRFEWISKKKWISIGYPLQFLAFPLKSNSDIDLDALQKLNNTSNPILFYHASCEIRIIQHNNYKKFACTWIQWCFF